MAAIEKEFEARSLKADLDVNEKVKFRKFMKELKTNDRKASAWGFVHVLSEILFFWSILAAAYVGAWAVTQGRIPAYAKGYLQMSVDFFSWINDTTAFIVPYAFICMMLFGVYRGNAERSRTKTVTSIISLLTFAEQKSLMFQMQDYVDQKVEQVERRGRTTTRKPGQTNYVNPRYK